MQHSAVIQIVYTTWRTHTAPSTLVIRWENVSVSLSASLSASQIYGPLWIALSLLPLARSLTLCTAMALPLIRSLSFSWPLFALKCEIILNILLNIFSTCRAALRRAATFLPVVSVYESIGILFILSQPENEKRKWKIKSVEGTNIQRICCFARSHKLRWFFFFFASHFNLKKIQATCTKFSPGVVVVVFKSCAQREGAWKTKTKSYIYIHIYLQTHTYTYIRIKFNSSSDNVAFLYFHFHTTANSRSARRKWGRVSRAFSFCALLSQWAFLSALPSAPHTPWQCVLFSAKWREFAPRPNPEKWSEVCHFLPFLASVSRRFSRKIQITKSFATFSAEHTQNSTMFAPKFKARAPTGSGKAHYT